MAAMFYRDNDFAVNTVYVFCFVFFFAMLSLLRKTVKQILLFHAFSFDAG